MEWYSALILLLGSLVVLLMLGLPVVFAFFAVNVVGAMLFLGGEPGLQQLVRNAVESVTRFSLAPIPLFLLMGEVMFHTGLARRAIDAVDKLIARVPGRLSLVAVASGTIFSALSGSTLANTAMLGSTLMPEMRKRGYEPLIAMGPILGTGGLAMIIVGWRSTPEVTLYQLPPWNRPLGIGLMALAFLKSVQREWEK